MNGRLTMNQARASVRLLRQEPARQFTRGFDTEIMPASWMTVGGRYNPVKGDWTQTPALPMVGKKKNPMLFGEEDDVY